MPKSKSVKSIIINKKRKMKIHWKTAIEKLKKGETILPEEIDFNNEKIEIHDVTILNKYSVRVPENLIFYNDENIDCSDIPEITENDIKAGTIQWIKIEEFAIDNEIWNWLLKQNININDLLPYLLKNFYQTIKFTQKNVAL